jgi:hypothetical protein
MPLQWNQPNEKMFETGLSHALLWIQDPETGLYQNGVPWEGLFTVTETPTGRETNKLWAHNVQYTQILSDEELEGKIEAYQYPPELDAAMGVSRPYPGVKVSEQKRTRFALSYQTIINSDGEGEDVGRLIHFLYNLRLKPSERNSETVNETMDALVFSWDFTSTKVDWQGDSLALFKPVSKVVVDTRYFSTNGLASLENRVYESPSLYTLPYLIYDLSTTP